MIARIRVLPDTHPPRRYIAIAFDEDSAPITVIDIPPNVTIERIEALRHLCLQMFAILDQLAAEVLDPARQN